MGTRPAIITTPPLKVEDVAKVFGISRAETKEIVERMDQILAKMRQRRARKRSVAKGKTGARGASRKTIE